MDENNKVLLTAQEVASLLNVKMSMAYKIIRNCNAELEKMNKLTIRGKVNRKFLLKKLDVSEV